MQSPEVPLAPPDTAGDVARARAPRSSYDSRVRARVRVSVRVRVRVRLRRRAREHPGPPATVVYI